MATISNDEELPRAEALRRAYVAAALGGLCVALVIFLDAHGYGSLIEEPVAPATVPPQVAGAIVSQPTAPLPSITESPAATSTAPAVNPSEPPLPIAPPAAAPASPAEPPPLPSHAATSSAASFLYTFNTDGTLHEARTMDESTSPYFWLSAGGSLVMEGGLGRTLSGVAPTLSRWRISYLRWNPLDTESGLYPQNIFRLVTRHTFGDARVEAAMRIDQDNLTATPNRNASNGLLLMTRYQDKDTLYYAGIRVDGTAVIKKKYKGIYYTMAQKPFLPGKYGTDSPDLLPHGEWLTLAAETGVDSRGGVKIDLYLKREGEERFTLLLSAYDDGKKYGKTPPIAADGHAGIRTDFMDVSFQGFRVDPL